MTHSITGLLVGAFARPPALAVITSLASNTPVRLEPEPGNVYDILAVKVLVARSAIPQSQRVALDVALAGFGIAAEEFWSSDQWAEIRLGYIASATGKPLKLARVDSPGLAGNDSFTSITQGVLKFGPDGKPRVTAEVPAADSPILGDDDYDDSWGND